MGFSRSNEAPSAPGIECEDCSQVPYNNNNNSEIDLGSGWKKKRKKENVMHAPPRPANRRLVTTCFWWFCPHTQHIRNRSCVYHRWSLLPVLWTSGGLKQLEFSNCISCILKPPSDSLETSMACADMFMELKLGVTGKRFPIKSLAWHKSQQEERLSRRQLTQALSVLLKFWWWALTVWLIN